MELKLVLPVPISINKLYVNQYSFNPQSRRREPTGARVLSSAGQKRKDEIQFHTKQQMKNQEWDYEWTKTGFLYQDAIFHFARRGTDDDNAYKLLKDSLEKICFDNDSRVLVRTQKIVYDSKNPRVEVTLIPVDFVGIFDSQVKADAFEDGCKGCTRYLDSRCSILVDSLAGTVREEIGSIDEPECVKYKEKK